MSFRFERTDGKLAANCVGNSTNDMYDVVIQPGEDALMILLAVCYKHFVRFTVALC